MRGYGRKYQRGKYKKRARVLEKARLCYGGDIQRITDFERRTIICKSLGEIESMVREMNGAMTFIRVKNRFANENRTAKETGGYRDFQVLGYIPGSLFVVEFQFHLETLHDVKSKAEGMKDADGKDGHDRYVEFRTIKEGLRKLFPNLDLWN